MANNDSICRGDVCLVDFGKQNESKQAGMRPAVVLQNNIGNQHSPTVIVAPMTSQKNKANLPTHVLVRKGDGGIKMDSILLAEQITLVSKSQISRIIGSLSPRTICQINNAVKVSLAL